MAIKCVNALSRAGIISTPPLWKPSIYAGCRTCFCRYFSEYSDNSSKQGVKVGRATIVLFLIQFYKSIYASTIFDPPKNNRILDLIYDILASITLPVKRLLTV